MYSPVLSYHGNICCWNATCMVISWFCLYIHLLYMLNILFYPNNIVIFYISIKLRNSGTKGGMFLKYKGLTKLVYFILMWWIVQGQCLGGSYLVYLWWWHCELSSFLSSLLLHLEFRRLIRQLECNAGLDSNGLLRFLSLLFLICKL